MIRCVKSFVDYMMSRWCLILMMNGGLGFVLKCF